ncbi:MAG: M23 family metallopeptidase [Lachnospiraceae bacterium]|nr:M23 family metallopeptidase [Lachnospiraceae bacterium]
MKKRWKSCRFYLLSMMVPVVIDWFMIAQLCRYEPPERDGSRLQMPEQIISREIECFPIAFCEESGLTFDFTDTWMVERSYGGERCHEGCDIITSENQRGVYPVVSMTDGVVEQIGWLTLGGYRIGIRSDSGAYYYYAHLESYADGISEGDEIFAGEFLGFAGDSGYGDEGTVGQFAVHLHVGIYIPDENGEDTAVDPYPYLEAVRGSQILAVYLDPGS